jgi:[ribosomal protein S5]-alanine N-acetyltransferase
MIKMKRTGENIAVQLVEESDANSLLALEVRNKHFFQQFTGLRDSAFYTYEGQAQRIKKEMECISADKGYLFMIRLKGSEEVIGEVMLTEVVRENLQSCWIGYFLDQDHNGKGYMTEAVQLVVHYAFQELHFHRIEAGVMPHNIGSIKVLLKAGFHKEGIARKNVKINGKWEDHQILVIIHDDDE